jgi:hypothetical protein
MMWVCPKCGSRNYDAGVFCDNCGEPIPSGLDTATFSKTNRGDSRSRIKDAIERRAITDTRISTRWTLLAAIGFFATGGIYVVYILMIALHSIHLAETGKVLYWLVGPGHYIAMALFGVFFPILAFKLIMRMNLHTQREEDLRASVMAFLRGLSKEPIMKQELVDQLLSLSAFDGQAMVYEKRPDATKWALGLGATILIAGLPGIMFYVFPEVESFRYIALILALELATIVSSFFALGLLITLGSHLMRTIYTHSIRWQGFSAMAEVAIRRQGFPFVPQPAKHQIKERSVLAYAGFTIVTLGLFGFYWLYTLIDDPNKHFEDQWKFEDELKNVVC